MDESGIEPKTSPMLRERATNYATRPCIRIFFKIGEYGKSLDVSREFQSLEFIFNK